MFENMTEKQVTRYLEFWPTEPITEIVFDQETLDKRKASQDFTYKMFQNMTAREIEPFE